MRTYLCILLYLFLSQFSFGQSISPAGPVGICPGESITLSTTTSVSWEYASALSGPWNLLTTGTSYNASNVGYYRIYSNPGPVYHDTIQITAKPVPTASFSSNPSGQCGTVPVQFANTSTGIGLSYSWNFGDPNSNAANTSTATNPAHTFIGTSGNGNQSFTINLTVTNSAGCSASTTGIVNTKQLPDATLGGPGPTVYNGKNYFKKCTTASSAQFDFTNLSTTTATNTFYTIVWGDATPDYTSATFVAPVPHTYTVGTHTLLFIVAGQNGCIDTTTYYVFLGSNPAVGLGNPGNTAICTSNTLTFPISATNSNTPGTVYTVTFNDGTGSQTFPHPAPADISHTFLLSSCGTDSPGYPNSFSATIQASNPCASSSATVVPIYVSEKDTSDFSISPNDTVCVNSNVTFTNTTGDNYNIDNGVCTPGNAVWVITPSTGYTITSGTLGNDFGLTDPSSWMPGTDVLVVNFTTPGSYSIKLKTGNLTCGLDSIIKQICVNPTPTGSFNVNQNTGCVPLTVNTTTTTNVPVCGVNTYLWTVTYAATAGCSPSTSSYNYLAGTSNTSAQPVFQFNNPGIYTLELTIIAPASACSTQLASQQITVKGKPIISIGSVPSSICQGESINPTSTASCYIDAASTYAWSFPGGTPTSSNNPNPGPVVYNSTGSPTISLAVGNVCGTTTTTASITVSPTPIPNVPANIVRCAGANIGPLNFSSTTPGATFSWTNSNSSIGIPASGTGNSIPVFTASNTGGTPVTATITVTASLNGCSSTASFTITINPLPLLPTVSSPVNYCQNATATALTATASAGNTLLWYSTATGGTGTTTAPTPLTTIVGTTSYYVSQVNTASTCEGPRAQIVVNVNPSPNISGNSHINPNACGAATGSITLTGLTPGISYTVSYTVNGSPQTTTIIAGPGGNVIIPALTAGIYNNITVTSLGCTSNTIGPITLTDPSTPATPTAGSNSPLCEGNTLNLTASTTSPGAATYTWTGPNSYSAATQNTSISNAPATATGNYFVTVTINGCTSLPGAVNVIVNPTPALPTISNNSPLCTGNTLNLNSTTTFPGPLSYSWTGPNGFANNQADPSVTNVTTAATGTYSLTITATTGSCASPQATTAVVVNITPQIVSGTASNPTACASATGSITLTGLPASQTFTVNYTYNSSAQTQNATSTAAGNLTIMGLTAGVYTNIIAILNGCSSNPAGPFTLTDPNPPATPVINNSGPVCSGNSLTLTSTAAPAGATYNWTGPNGFTSALQNPVINAIQSADAGVYSLSITLNACTSASATTTVVVNETPATPTTGNNGPVCTGNTLNLTASTTFSGAVTYSWTGPNAFTSNQQNPSITNITAAANGTYTVTATAQVGTCISQPATTVVVVNTTPAISSGTSVNPGSCASATGSITLNGLIAGNNYTVNYIKDGSAFSVNITANASGQVIITNLTAGVYTNIIVSLLGCPSQPAGPFTLTDPNPPAPPVAGSNSSICLGQTLNLTATSGAVGTLSFSWTGPNGFSSSQQNPVISNTTTLNAGMYYVNVQVNNCTSLNDSVLVVINPLGALPTAASPVGYCIDQPSVALTANTDPNNTLNWYTVATGGTALASAPVPSTVVVGSTFYYVSQTTALGCEGPRTAIEVIIHPNAIASFTPTDTIGCPQFTLTPAIINLQPFPANNSTYEWYANGVSIGTGAVFPGYTIVNENDMVSIKLKAISLFGCKNDSVTHNFHTYHLPHPSFTMSDSVGCGPLIVQFQNTTPNITQFSYVWDFGNGITSTLEQPGAVSFLSNPTYNDTVYVIKLKVLSICDTVIYSDSVRVKSKPRALYSPSISTGCSPMNVVFTNTSGGNNNTYHWNLGDGTIFTTTSADTFSHIYHTGVVDTFRVQLIAENECGADTIAYDIIAVPNNIHLNYFFNGQDASGCAPHTVAFFNNTTGGSLFEWDFGDGNTQTTVDNVDTVYHTYLTDGVFTVSVHAINNCTDTTAIRTITVYPKPVPSFTPSTNNICIGQNILFTNQSNNANAYNWNFGDGTGSTLVNPTHAYLNEGVYAVTLISYHNNPDGSSCIDSVHAQIQVSDSLPGNITLSAINGNCVPFTITFINHNTPSVTCTWNFGDGNSATGDSVVHTYTTPGVYTVTNTVIVPGGCTYTSSQVVTISGPSGSLLYTGGYVCYPDPVRFEAVASGTNNLIWNFGDGNTISTNQLVVYHSYANPGVYIPSVTLQSTGCDYPILGIDTIKVDKIDAGFTWAENQHCGYTDIVFTDTSHVFFGESLIEWDFGDGNAGTGNTVTHQYLASGTYNIVMVVTGNSGCTDTIRKQLILHVNNIPVTTITGPVTGCTNQQIDFLSNVVSTDPINMSHWTLSNGVTADGNSFTYMFTGVNTYNLQLITGTVNGCFDTAYHSIVINPTPTVTSGANTTICLGGSVQLNATGPSPLQWTPIQGLSCTSCNNPVATPIVTTPYIVSGTNSFGCTGTDTTVVTVIQPLQITVSPGDSICIGQSTNLLASGANSYQWTPATGLNNTTIQNPTANPVITTNYMVVGYDGYNCFTDTAFVLVAIGEYPTVDLGPDLTLATGTMHPLTSTITNGPIAQWLWEPATDLSCNDCNIPIAEVKHDINYKVTVTTAYGCSATDNINIKVFCLDAQVFIPNAFTPNGDGRNDILMVRGKGIVTVKYFRIFNRWGEVIFERNNFPPNDPSFGWDGTVKGKPCPPGVFIYTAGVICENGTPYEYKGNTTILK